MSETGSKKNSTMIALAVVLAVAVILSVVLFNQRNSLSAQVDTLSEELAESREAWETTAAEKEAIEAELKETQDNLREAETALEESTATISRLEADLAEAERVRIEAQASLDIVYDQIDGLIVTLDYARGVLGGEPVAPIATAEPAAEPVDEEALVADDEEPTEPVADDEEIADDPADDAGETADEPLEDMEVTEPAADEPEADTEADAEAPEALAAELALIDVEPVAEPVETDTDLVGTATDLADADGETDVPEIPEDAVALEIALNDETTVTLYVLVEDGTITFIYAEDIDEAFLEQFVGKTLPVTPVSDEEPEGIAPIENDETATLAVIEAVNSLFTEDEPVEEEAA